MTPSIETDSDFYQKNYSHRDSATTETASNFDRKKKKSLHHYFTVHIPAEQLKRIGDNYGISSVTKETQQFVGLTTVHGVLRIYRGHGLIRILWIIAVILCIVFCIWQVFYLIRYFAKKPTTAQVSYISPDGGMDLPRITICTDNNIRKSYITALNESSQDQMSADLLDYIASSYLQPRILWGMGNAPDSILLQGEKLLQNFINSSDANFTINQFFLDAGPKCNETLKICAFAGTIFDCCKFTNIVLTDLGKCFQIDLLKIPTLPYSTQTQSGISDGLQLFIDYQSDQHVKELQFSAKGSYSTKNANRILAQSTGKGFRIYIHSGAEISFMSTERVTVSPGACLYSTLSPTRYVLLPENKWGNCINSWPNEFKKSGIYSSTKCKALCWAKFYNDHCGCSPFIYNVHDGDFFLQSCLKKNKRIFLEYKVCSAFRVYECILYIQNKTKKNDFPIPPCDFCRMECDRWVYLGLNSYDTSFTNGAIDWLNEQFPTETVDHIRQNYAAVNIFYRDLGYTKYQESKSTSFTQTVSNVGGTTGMCLGISFISMIELIVYLSKLTWIFISKKRRKHLIEKRQEEEERQKTLEMTLQKINSKNNLDEKDEDKPLTFQRIAKSIKRRVTQVFPKKQHDENQKVNDNFLHHMLYQDGRATFDKHPEYVAFKMDPIDIQKALKASRFPPHGKPRSNSCPRDSVGWIHPMISYDASAASLDSSMNSPSVIPEETKITESDETSNFDFAPEKNKTQRSISQDSDSVVVEIDDGSTTEVATIPEDSHHPIFYIKN